MIFTVCRIALRTKTSLWGPVKNLQGNSLKAFLLVRPAGFEPAAYGFVVRRSIRTELRALYYINLSLLLGQTLSIVNPLLNIKWIETGTPYAKSIGSI